jgi:hypothetical protein
MDEINTQEAMEKVRMGDKVWDYPAWTFYALEFHFTFTNNLLLPE